MPLQAASQQLYCVLFVKWLHKLGAVRSNICLRSIQTVTRDTAATEDESMSVIFVIEITGLYITVHWFCPLNHELSIDMD